MSTFFFVKKKKIVYIDIYTHTHDITLIIFTNHKRPCFNNSLNSEIHFSYRKNQKISLRLFHEKTSSDFCMEMHEKST